MTTMASVAYLILTIATGNSHQIQMESWQACKKVIDQLAGERDRGGVAQALCVSLDGRVYSLPTALAARHRRRG